MSNFKSVRSVTPYHIYHIGGTFIIPAPAGLRGKVTDLERMTVVAPNREAASHSLATFLNNDPKWVKMTHGEGFSSGFAISHLKITETR